MLLPLRRRRRRPAVAAAAAAELRQLQRPLSRFGSRRLGAWSWSCALEKEGRNLSFFLLVRLLPESRCERARVASGVEKRARAGMRWMLTRGEKGREETREETPGVHESPTMTRKRRKNMNSAWCEKGLFFPLSLFFLPRLRRRRSAIGSRRNKNSFFSPVALSFSFPLSGPSSESREPLRVPQQG